MVPEAVDLLLVEDMLNKVLVAVSVEAMGLLVAEVELAPVDDVFSPELLLEGLTVELDLDVVDPSLTEISEEL
jgi:hypothetical protein